MLNTVVLLTPPNHKTASSITCGHLRPIVANTVFTKSMLAHLLSALNHWFEIIRVFGHLHFRCYTTWSWSCIKFEMSIWSRILRSTQKSEWALQNKMNILLFVKKRKKTIFDNLKQRHQVVGVKKFLTKISSVKNYPRSEIFKFIAPFYQVLIIRSGSFLSDLSILLSCVTCGFFNF
jgi:hypothetical protein